ncbi:DUF4298 domain-containing protein [Streptococcus sp. zg-86]|uniref:DUF4298 domain-containing protein n=2 Tax=Streptococcus TaxID=1301 RepID=A0ABW9R0J7_9STRE|nr:DUF4298 domain-containing protein [Streptococcus sp. zg-86]MTB89752.1 DUF4298 domain-containing protein [Streptococcus sp. zg-36]
MNDIKKIQEMEEILNQAETVLTNVEQSLEIFEQFQPSLASLFAYYESKEWMRHYQMDEAEQLPKDMARGVLSEDAVYNTIARHRELMKKMKELGNKDHSSI